jgi:hypothetical protein
VCYQDSRAQVLFFVKRFAKKKQKIPLEDQQIKENDYIRIDLN